MEDIIKMLDLLLAGRTVLGVHPYKENIEDNNSKAGIAIVLDNEDIMAVVIEDDRIAAVRGYL